MSSIEKLKAMEETKNYVFHGSPDGNIDILEPRQGTHVPDLAKSTDTILDGEPAISATPYSKLAIFRAIINKKNIPLNHTSGFGSKAGILEFRVSNKEVLEHAKGKKGFVYAFNKSDFEPYNRSGNPHPKSMEWRAYKAVTPLEIVEVNSDHLPSHEQIEITDK